MLNAGFAAAPVTMAILDAGEAKGRPDLDAPVLLAYARGIGLKVGDVQSLVLSSPSGHVIAKHEAQPLEQNQAQSLIFAGLRKPAGGWSKGTYRAKYLVSHEGNPVLERSFEVDLQ